MYDLLIGVVPASRGARRRLPTSGSWHSKIVPLRSSHDFFSTRDLTTYLFTTQTLYSHQATCDHRTSTAFYSTSFSDSSRSHGVPVIVPPTNAVSYLAEDRYTTSPYVCGEDDFVDVDGLTHRMSSTISSVGVRPFFPSLCVRLLVYFHAPGKDTSLDRPWWNCVLV